MSTTFTGEERLLVDGELRAASGGGTFETLNPAAQCPAVRTLVGAITAPPQLNWPRKKIATSNG